MEGDFIKINEWLLPLSWLYGLGVRIRNWCFNIGLLKQRSFATPVISVGNLTVGGCGKTPHVEYLVSLLKKDFKVAILSRGYKRVSSGYVLATKDSTMPELGDEPFQMKEKFHDVFVAVDKKRCHGIDRLTHDEETKSTQVIILDDAYQHRYVKPGINLLLVDYHRLIVYDKLLPAGRLREPKDEKERADMVIVTKCPANLRPMDYRVLTKAMDLRPYQKLFFTGISYDSLRDYEGDNSRPLSSIMPDENILLFSGIASPEQITTDLAPYSKRITVETFADHHQYTLDDLMLLKSKFSAMAEPKFLITTEKDAARLRHLSEMPEEIRKKLYILPIKVEFKLDKQAEFNSRIRSFVENALVMGRINKDKR